MKKLFIILAIVCLAAPVMAADWNFYGSERFQTYSVHKDTDTSGNNSTTTNTLWDQQDNSRLGAKVKFSDQISGNFEFGIGASGVTQRHLYGTYTFGNGGKLLIGQTWTLVHFGLANTVFGADGSLYGIGEFYESRQPQIRLTMGGFNIALVKPKTTVSIVEKSGNTLADVTAGDYVTKVTIPKIEVSYDLKSDKFSIRPFAGYQTYDLDGTSSAIKDLTVNSYIVGVGGSMDFGPMYVKMGAHYGQNLGNFGATGRNGLDGNGNNLITDAMVVKDQSEKDTECWGAEGVVGFNASDRLTIEAGAGYEYGEVDLPNADGSSLYQVYLNATINIAPGFFIVPEVGYAKADGETFGTSPDPNPSTTYFGAKWQINF